MKAVAWMCLLSMSAVTYGCADGNACDPDMVRDRNYCLKETPLDSAGGMGGLPEAPPEPSLPSEIFGRVCTLESEADVCGGDAPDCGLAPGSDEGICTVFGCETTPETVVCPVGWYCFGLADACLEE